MKSLLLQAELLQEQNPTHEFIIPSATQVEKNVELKKRDLMAKYGLQQKSFNLSMPIKESKETIAVTVQVAYVNLSKFLTELFTLPEWQELYSFEKKAYATMFWDGTPTRSYAKDKDKRGQVSGTSLDLVPNFLRLFNCYSTKLIIIKALN